MRELSKAGSVAAVLLLFAMCSRRAGQVFEIPEGFRGWVEITYSSRCTERLPMVNGRQIVRPGRDGRLCVSDAWSDSAGDEFWYVSGPRRIALHEETPGTGMIWGRSTRQIDRGDERTDRFFVGTRREFEQHREAPEPFAAGPRPQ